MRYWHTAGGGYGGSMIWTLNNDWPRYNYNWGRWYPDLDPGESGESLAPYHQVTVLPDTPEGHKVGFALHWTSDGASGVTEPLFLPLGEAQCASFAASDLPQSIFNHTFRPCSCTDETRPGN